MKILLALMAVATMMVTSADSVYDFSFTSIDGEKVNLSSFEGKKILIVNTASKCGYTPQYKGLQELAEKYANDLVVIGFPSGNFREQELASNELIQEFCEANYGVTFLLAEKSDVKGSNITPLFKYLTSVDNPDFKGDINWNFEKFLIDEHGKLIHRFRSKVEPMSKELVSKI